MILDLKQYQASSPYPPIDSVHEDKKLAAELLGGYSGERSELSTVLQYAYHNLRLQNGYDKIAQTIRGVFYVETLHLKFLGECIARLGGDVRYTIKLEEKSLYWQAALIDYKTNPSQMLLADIEGERYAAGFYKKLAAEVNQKEISKLMLRLSEDEELHIRIFTDLYKQYFR